MCIRDRLRTGAIDPLAGVGVPSLSVASSVGRAGCPLPVAFLPPSRNKINTKKLSSVITKKRDHFKSQGRLKCGGPSTTLGQHSRLGDKSLEFRLIYGLWFLYIHHNILLIKGLKLGETGDLQKI